MEQFILISDYFHAYEIPGLHDDLLKYKEEMINKYNSTPLSPNTFNMYFDNVEFDMKYQTLFINITHKYYVVDNNWNKNGFGIYLQDNKINTSAFHTHIDKNTITAVTYIDPPIANEGGGLEIFDPQRGFVVIQPVKDRIYFFPSWMIHRPIAQSSNIPRISINWGYRCSLRPVHKLTGNIW